MLLLYEGHANTLNQRTCFVVLNNEKGILLVFFPFLSQEDPPSMQEESAGGETSYRESYDDVTVDRLLNHIPLVS